MKKQLLGYIIVMMMFFTTSTKAQLADGSIAPDFTGTDINGTQWHLYDLLNQGKTVVLDISAAWCGPCWRYHVAPFLNDVQAQYGPNGTNEMMVFFIEGEGTNSIDQINGISTGSTYATYTQGNWVTGTNYPIIDSRPISNSYQISYFPSLFIICPDKTTRLMQQTFNTSGVATGPTAAQIYNLRNVCSFSTTANDAGITNSFDALNGEIRTCSAASLSYRLANYGSTPLTSADVTLNVNGTAQATTPWTGTLATYESTVLSFAGVTGTSGTNNVDIVVSNPNGQADGNAANNTNSSTFLTYPPVGGPPVNEAYTAATFPPAGWSVINGGTQTATWTRSTAGFNGAGSAKMDFWTSPDPDVDALQLPALDMTGLTGATMTFDLSHCQYLPTGGSLSNDNIKVRVSINCGNTWTNVFNKSGTALATVAGGMNGAFTPTTAAQWRSETVNLNSFIGYDNVFVKIEGTSDYGNNVYVDNVNLTFATGINTITKTVSFNLYPNPATSSSQVEFTLENKSDVSIHVFNKIGEMVYQCDYSGMIPGDQSVELNTSKYAPGVYTVNVKTSEGTVMKKLIVN